MHATLRLGALVAALLLVGVAAVRASEDGDAVASPGEEPSGPLLSGIVADVSICSGCPGPTDADPDCSARLSQIVISVLDQNDRIVSQDRPDADGSCQFMLPPGTYRVRPERGPWITARA